jgi:hypothetical protein
LYQTPNDGCRNPRDYSPIDLTAIDESFIPLSVFWPNISRSEYFRHVGEWNGRPVTDYFRVAARKMIDPTGGRTLFATIIPPHVGHIHACFSILMNNFSDLIKLAWLFSSIPFDFYVKTTGKTNFSNDIAKSLPWPNSEVEIEFVIPLVLRLVCLTMPYAPLWEAFKTSMALKQFVFTKNEPRLRSIQDVNDTWNFAFAFRTDFQRRQALVELDVLAAIALRLSPDELVSIYKVQFPIVQKSERADLFDQAGRIVPNFVLEMAGRNNIDIHHPLKLSSFRGSADLVGEGETPGFSVTGGIVWEDPKMEPRIKRVYPPPFTKCDREADMRQAYRVFQERIRSQEQAP